MFTGIVSAVGTVVERGPNRIGVSDATTARRLAIGASVAVNGCCLTVVEKSRGTFYADVVPETLQRTNLGRLRKGSRVNLELPMPAQGRFDGHIVQGHVDSTARVTRVERRALGREITIQLPANLRPFVAEKGSIAVDGTSLTVATVNRTRSAFGVALIPHTLAATIAAGYRSGSVVNLEADVVARYVVNMTWTSQARPEPGPKVARNIRG